MKIWKEEKQFLYFNYFQLMYQHAPTMPKNPGKVKVALQLHVTAHMSGNDP
jgi:hypothetical protein